VGQEQLVEIAKAIDRNSSVLIMDEPTSAIGEKETSILFEAIAHLKSQGVGIIYVSHRLSELFSIADEHTVFRGGHFVRRGNLCEIGRDDLIRLIVGRTLVEQRRTATDAQSQPFWKLQDSAVTGNLRTSISRSSPARFRTVRTHGCWPQRICQSLWNIPPRPRLNGNRRPRGEINSPKDALTHSIAMMKEDRKATGLILIQGVRENTSLTSLTAFARWGFLNERKGAVVTDGMAKPFDIKGRSRGQPVRRLSGGNQQKILFARSLTTSPRILICDEPTRGLTKARSARSIHFWRSLPRKETRG
jgi:ABC-type sugar transport system ATPase subunit